MFLSVPRWKLRTGQAYQVARTLALPSARWHPTLNIFQQSPNGRRQALISDDEDGAIYLMQLPFNNENPSTQAV